MIAGRHSASSTLDRPSSSDRPSGTSATLRTLTKLGGCLDRLSAAAAARARRGASGCGGRPTSARLGERSAPSGSGCRREPVRNRERPVVLRLLLDPVRPDRHREVRPVVRAGLEVAPARFAVRAPLGELEHLRERRGADDHPVVEVRAVRQGRHSEQLVLKRLQLQEPQRGELRTACPAPPLVARTRSRAPSSSPGPAVATSANLGSTKRLTAANRVSAVSRG